jgi:hypothetical protein
MALLTFDCLDERQISYQFVLRGREMLNNLDIVMRLLALEILVEHVERTLNVAVAVIHLNIQASKVTVGS